AEVNAFLSTACKDEPDKYQIQDGTPVIHYIRPVGSASSDSLITSAYLDNQICIVGENLRSITELYFNDKKAILNTSYITDKTLIVSVPGTIPTAVDDKIHMINKNGVETLYDFHVLVPAPSILGMSNEYAKPGKEVQILGSYFADDKYIPLKVTIAGKEIPVDKITETAITFTMPEGIEEGPITVTTIYGTTESAFHYKETRGMITNFDNPDGFADYSGTKGIVPQGWNLKIKYSDVDGIDGYYAEVGPAELDETGAWQEELKMSFWCGNWNGNPMSIKEGAGTPLRNAFAPGYFSKPNNLALKFELYIPSTNPWKSGSMQILFVNNQQCANDDWQNNTYIHTSASGGLDLCRGLYRPWVEKGSYDTGNDWVTVTIPLSDFTYNADGTPGKVALSEESFDSFIIWPWSGGVNGTACTPIFRYDNIRVVPIK
ncbi:MAG: hypothetical protein HUK08_05590, partial [Bacteroidaceae bacterium]|nr:hypothetical protein [Bacteroidaceae bacterium]